MFRRGFDSPLLFKIKNMNKRILLGTGILGGLALAGFLIRKALKNDKSRKIISDIINEYETELPENLRDLKEIYKES